MSNAITFTLIITIQMSAPTQIPAGTYQSEAECIQAGKDAAEMINDQFKQENVRGIRVTARCDKTTKE
jgi:hypothetical protein